MKKAKNKDYKSNLISSEVEYTLTIDCFFNALSSDQIGQLSFNANAKYSMSSESGEILQASLKNSLMSSLSNNKSSVTFFAIIAENSSFASTTISIYTKPSFFNLANLPSFSFLPNSIASFSVSLLLEEIVLRATNLSNSSLIESVTAFDISNLDSFNSESNSSGISTFNSAISSSQVFFGNSRYLNFMHKVNYQ